MNDSIHTVEQPHFRRLRKALWAMTCLGYVACLAGFCFEVYRAWRPSFWTVMELFTAFLMLAGLLAGLGLVGHTLISASEARAAREQK